MVELGNEAEVLLEEAQAQGAATQVSPGQLTLFELKSGLSTMVKATIVFVGLGVASLAVAFVDWIQQLVPANNVWLGWFFKGVDSAIQKGVQVLTQAVGNLYNGASPEVGQGFHEIASALKLLGADVFATAFTTFKTSQVIVALSHKPNLAPIVKQQVKIVRPLPAQIKAQAKRTATITKIITRPLPAWVPVRIHHLETQVKRQQVELAQLQKQAHATPHPSTLTQAASVVALGLAGLGLNASRCEGTKGLNRGACDLGPQGVNDLLSLLAIGAGLLTLREYTQIAQAATHGTVDVVKTLLSVP